MLLFYKTNHKISLLFDFEYTANNLANKNST